MLAVVVFKCCLVVIALFIVCWSTVTVNSQREQRQGETIVMPLHTHKWVDEWVWCLGPASSLLEDEPLPGDGTHVNNCALLVVISRNVATLQMHPRISGSQTWSLLRPFYLNVNLPRLLLLMFSCETSVGREDQIKWSLLTKLKCIFQKGSSLHYVRSLCWGLRHNLEWNGCIFKLGEGQRWDQSSGPDTQQRRQDLLCLSRIT